MLNDNQLREYLKSPLTLFSLREQEDINQVNNLLPYSTGFEIECGIAEGIINVREAISHVPNLMDNDSGNNGEQRFRIPNGILGIICLYQLSRQLKENLRLNPDSGIHYHVDCKTDSTYKQIKSLEDIPLLEWILLELDKWGYKGEYNKRGFANFSIVNTKNIPMGAWVRANDLQTIEYRVGEMTFEYDLLLKRIIHVNAITRRMKEFILPHPSPVYKNIDIDMMKTILVHEKMARISSANPLAMKMAVINEELRQLKLEEAGRTSLIDPLTNISGEVRKRLHKIDTGFHGE